MGRRADPLEKLDQLLIPDHPRSVRELDWMAEANCQGRTTLFFSERVTEREEAKSLCLRCPVLSACTDWRDRVGPSHGIWAGAGAGVKSYERKRERKRQQAEQADQQPI